MKSETWVEMELEGSADQAVAFVEGFRLAMWGEEAVWFCDEENVRLEGILDGIRSILHLERHVILRKDLAEKIASVLSRSPRLDLEVKSIREIEYAELEFGYELYSREEAEKIRGLVEKDLPEGVRLEDYEPEEEVEEDAKGVELYGPVHDYTLRAKGRYVGPVPGIIEMGRRLADRDFIKPEKVVLHRVVSA